MAKKKAGKKKTTSSETSKKKSPAKATGSAKGAKRKTRAKPSGGKKEPAKKRPPELQRPEIAPPRTPGFPIVGIGASAGGLEALEEFFDQMSTEPGMAFVVVTHQHPGHTSLLADLLQRHTKMPVVDAADNTKVAANHVYVAVPGSELAMMGGTLLAIDAGGARQKTKRAKPGTASVSERSTADRIHLPIDSFLRSLADDQGARAICIILSGTGTDGTLGLKAIKAESGLAMVQEPDSAKYSGMPASAISTGLADFVLPPSEMPEQLLAYANSSYLARPDSTEYALPEEPLRKILLLLRSRTGHDFSSYKSTTIRRRIERRMVVHAIDKPSHYVKFLNNNSHEIDLLFNELLISVTGFFRDQEAWKALADKALPTLLESRPNGYHFRAWVVGCASGEEAYTVAILLRETAEQLGKHFEFQVFGTDLNADAIAMARHGVYADGIAADVSAARLERNFTREDSTFRVSKTVREMCVFAPQNVIKDPPFGKLDLVCCRNLLIYVNAKLQQRLLPIFHYTLNPGGILMLGPSESLGGQSVLFETVDTRWKLFARRESAIAPQLPSFPAQPTPRADDADRPSRSVEPQPPTVAQIAPHVGRMLLARFAPPSIVVNGRGDIVHIHGRTGRYLEPAAGQPTMNVLEMAREGLRLELGTCLQQAAKQHEEVRREGVAVHSNGDVVYVDLSVSRIAEPASIRGLLLIAITPASDPPIAAPRKKPRRSKAQHDPLELLQRELQYTNETLQSTVEELETSNEELKSTNEELQSTNEELQSSNEELETSREEMQSLNEELNTMNVEMQEKLNALMHANDDLHNLLNSTDLATIFLDTRLRIRRFNESGAALIKMIQSDVGRYIGDLNTALKYDSLENDAREVLRTLVTKEANLESNSGQCYLMRMMPYRTLENVIDGLVITFSDITLLQDAMAMFQSIVETTRQPLVVLNDDLRIVQCNRAFYEAFGLVDRQTVGELIYDASGGAWDNSDLRTLLEDILPGNTTIENFAMTHTFPRIGQKKLILNSRRLQRASDQPGMILLAMEDVT